MKFTRLHGAAVAALGTAALAGIALAQDAPPPPATPAEASARADTRFATLDTNRDGQVTQAELDAARQQRAETRGPGRGGERMAGRMFERLDTDKSGGISQAEFRAGATRRLDRAGAGKGADAGPAGRQAKRGGPDRGARMMARLDTNRDGAISQAEFAAESQARFQRLDTNRDGRIDAAELQAMRDRRGPQDGPGAPPPPPADA